MLRRFGSVCGLLGSLSAASAFASSAGDRPLLEELVVRAHPLPTEQLAQSYRVVEGDELLRRMDSTLGAVVGQMPGVTTTFFGQAVGRPVIHGLGGIRVRVMEDHIASLDASVLSDDHAVTIDPALADSIEILKGPSTLLYGSGAIGGVVDVHSGRVPKALPEVPFSGRFDTRFDDVADQRSGSLRVDGRVGSFAWHADGFRRLLDAYEIPGYAESAALRRAEAEDAESHSEEAPEEARGELPNSDLDTEGGAFGLSFVGARAYVGISRSAFDAEYGLPGGHGHEHGELEHDDGSAALAGADLFSDAITEADGVRLDLRQRRWDLAAGATEPAPGWNKIELRLGINDYEHSEIEAPGEVGTRYSVKAWETRLEAEHERVAGWHGVMGLQFGEEDFVSVGEEAYAPPYETRTGAIFLIEERTVGLLTLQAGARIERIDHETDLFGGEDFSAASLSLGLILPLPAGWELGLAADFAERAPTAAELYSQGPHLATGAFEVGNAKLNVESSNSLAATLRYAPDRLALEATLYVNQFRDFIYLADTGVAEDDLPVRVWSQSDAQFQGLDLEARYALADTGSTAVDVRAFFDRVRAEIDANDDDAVPRLPGDRYGVGLEARRGQFITNLDYVRVMKRDSIASFETETAAYNDLRARVAATYGLGGSTVTLYVEGRNLTDDEQRNHVSFLKDLAPLPGRAIVAGLRLEF
ncbi:MAG: TonB-dependent receptor [Pseudomonadales bacterium]